MDTIHRFEPAPRPRMRTVWFFLCGVMLLLAGCGSGSGSGSSGNNIIVTMTNKVSSVQAGTVAVMLLATVQNDSTNSGVTWSLTANGAACSPSCGTLSLATPTSVTYTPPGSGPAAPNNQPTLTATSVAKTNKSDSDAFTITAALAVAITNKFSSVNTGASPFVVNATVQNDATNSGVSWKLTANGAACSPGCGTLTGATKTNVTYTSPSSIPTLPTATLTATSLQDNTKVDSDTFTVVTAAVSVSIGNKVNTAYAGSNAIFFNANVANDPSGGGVTWTLTTNGSSCTSACGTISPNNPPGQFGTFYTPPSSVPAPSSVTLTAVSYADATKSDSDTLTISALPAVSVTITQVKSVLAGTSGVNFSASIRNDPSSIPSVTWALTIGGSACAPSTCGSLANVQATTVTYVPPSAPVSSVKLTATSVYDSAKSGSDTFNATAAVANSCGASGGSESLLNGHYALLMEGFEGVGTGTPTLLAASFTANGSGGITGGEEDTNDSIAPQRLTFDAASGRSLYTIGPDHRGCLQLTNSAGTTTVFRFSVGSINSGVASKGRIIEFDDNSGSGAGSRGSGILRLQDTNAFTLTALKAQYAFGVEGWTESGTQSVHMSAAGSFSNNSGILSGVFDQNAGGIVPAEATNVTGSIGSISAVSGRADANFPQFVFDWAIYVVNSSEFFIIGTDPVSDNPLSIGVAIATSNAFTAASLSGNYVVHVTGNTNSSADVNLDLWTMTPGGAQTGTLSGTVNSYSAGNGAQVSALNGVTYNVDSISGRTTLGNPGDNLPILYLTTPTDGIAAFVAGVGADALFGMAEPQTNPALAAGTYIFGTEDPADNVATNKAGVESAASGGALTITYDQSNTSALLSSQSTSATVSLSSNGAGNIGPNTVAITTGSKLFSVDETGGTAGPAVIVVAEQ
jgi:hypothetical protein